MNDDSCRFDRVLQILDRGKFVTTMGSSEPSSFISIRDKQYLYPIPSAKVPNALEQSIDKFDTLTVHKTFNFFGLEPRNDDVARLDARGNSHAFTKQFGRGCVCRYIHKNWFGVHRILALDEKI
jgi:hypothetical protein